jgi:hypothetical protein
MGTGAVIYFLNIFIFEDEAVSLRKKYFNILVGIAGS